MTRSTIFVIIIMIALTLACGGGGGMEWKGTLTGTFELKDYMAATFSTYPPPAPLDTGSGAPPSKRVSTTC